jgi:hypothetical protein
VVAPEKPATALLATNSVADFRREGLANDQPQGFREAFGQLAKCMVWRRQQCTLQCRFIPYCSRKMTANTLIRLD